MNGSLLIDSEGHVSIQSAMPNSWFDAHLEFNDILVTGPFASEGGKETP